MTTEITQTMPQESIPQTVVTASADASAGARILYVDGVGWYFHADSGSTQILENDKTTPLYTINNKYGSTESGPRMTFTNATTKAVMGTVTIDALSKNMDLVVHDKPICLEASNTITSGRIFSSQAVAGRKFKWTFDSAFVHGLACTDGKDKVIAKFVGHSSLTKGENYFEIEPEVERELVDEIFVGGLAMAERRAQRNRHRFGGTVVSGLRAAGHPFKSSSHA